MLRKKKILLTGSNGLLGQKLIKVLATNDAFELVATSRGDNRCSLVSGYTYYSLDISDKNNIEELFQIVRPDVVIHAAAMTNVDACEDDHVTCLKMNVDAVNYLLQASEKHKIHFIHLSTDFIFNGTHGPLSEEEKPDPVSFYGHSKLQGESLVQQSTCKWAIVRTVLVYGVVNGMSRSNIVLWAKDALERGKSITVVDDQFRTPTLAEDLAVGCMLIAEKGATGIFHISGKDFMSVYDLVLRVADFWKLDKSLIKRSKSSDIKQRAQRPPITGFILNKAKAELNFEPHSFEEGLLLLNSQLKQVHH